ncbi:MAG: anthranilate phosphoribosyltransferase [Gammaproteobacteria bacterium]|jgi:anthranilate phosphoribosyltransferase|nr:anthranilate phosphoribosyltransferase [Gammaproteobacteria bacterium]HJP37481.1 anthranilate phosphoribosyltransferase [Gammaproteobacteria bacterium]
MDIRAAIAHAVAGKDVDFDDMLVVVRAIMSGEPTAAQIAGLLVALHMKGETIDEVTAAATVMRELATPVSISAAPLIDTCGTGGDATNTFNISTATAFVVAAAGGYVAKHGNRSVSSSSGSADVLEQAGARIDLEPAEVARSIEETGVGFMFAPAHHGATRHAAGPRRELAIRTLFNVLGPLTNPAGAPLQLVGVFNREWQTKLIEVLARLGSERAFVVHADDGLDEISIGSKTTVAELRDGAIHWFEIDPAEYGFEQQPISSVSVRDAGQSLAMIDCVFRGEPGPARDIVALNAGAAIYLCGLEDTLADGIERARHLLASGAAGTRFERFIDFTQRCGR